MIGRLVFTHDFTPQLMQEIFGRKGNKQEAAGFEQPQDVLRRIDKFGKSSTSAAPMKS